MEHRPRTTKEASLMCWFVCGYCDAWDVNAECKCDYFVVHNSNKVPSCTCTIRTASSDRTC